MNQKKTANPSIACTVSSCAYHSTDRDNCTLTEIHVGCCDPKVTDCSSTECASFRPGGCEHCR